MTTFEWQPIETAPKDGSRIIVSSGDWVCIAHWSDAPLRDREGDGERFHWVVFECDEDYWYSVAFTDERQPTHWMPLPPPPEGVSK